MLLYQYKQMAQCGWGHRKLMLKEVLLACFSVTAHHKMRDSVGASGLPVKSARKRNLVDSGRVIL